MRLNFFNRLIISATPLAVLLLTGCVAIDLDLTFTFDERIHNEIIDQTSDQFPEIDPLYISDEVKRLVDSHIRSRDGEETRVKKIQDLLYGEEFLFIQYADTHTHTALEAFHARQGNCLSVMNLYVAMARYAGVEANFQIVDVRPSWDRRGDLLVISQHINATGRFNVQRRYVVDFTPEISLQQLTAAIVTDRDARALYFNNLGVEALIETQTDLALVYFKNALFLDPDLSITWNNIGTTYNRLGNEEFAVYSYETAFAEDNTNAVAINNLAKFYRSNGNIGLASEYEFAIQRFNNVNPYFHFARGNVAYINNDFNTARRAFRRAVRLKETEPDFYLALAKIYLEIGDIEAAREMNESAQEILALNDEIYRPSDQKLRIIDSSSILRDSTPGFSIIFR